MCWRRNNEIIMNEFQLFDQANRNVESQESIETEQALKELFLKSVTEGLNKSTITARDIDRQIETESSMEEGIITLVEENNPDLHNQVYLTAERNDVKFGLFRNPIKVGGVDSSIIVEENVVSMLHQNRDTSFIRSVLKIVNSESGTHINLNKVLAGLTTFSPASLKSPNSALESYRGMNNVLENEDGFAYVPQQSEICYGDISTNEGLLSLLHEITHSWQTRFNPADAHESVYGNKIIRLCGNVSYFSAILEGIEAGNAEQPFLKKHLEDLCGQYGQNIDTIASFLKRYVERNTPELKRFGITIENGQVVNIANKSFEDSIPNQIWVERHAWATAIKAFRLMEQSGFIPEPEKEMDFASQVDPALRSYQRGLDSLGVVSDKKFILSTIEE